MTTQTMQNWSVSTLGDSVDIIDGDRGKNYPKQDEFLDSGYCLFLNTKNVPTNSFVFDEKMFITQEKDSALRKGKLTRGDFVLTTRGTVGNFAYYSNKIPFDNIRINSGMVILRLRKEGKLFSDYFKFYLDSPLFKGQIKSHATGSAQPQLPIRDLSVFEIVFPNLLTQQQIADVLSVYDDLLENNARRIKILEQMAQAIYTEWFVNFRFPNHEKVKMVDSGTDFGKIPEGWGIKIVEDLIADSFGGDWGEEEKTDSETCTTYIIRGTDMPDLLLGNKDRLPKRYISDRSLKNKELLTSDVIIENSINAKSRCVGTSFLITDNVKRFLDAPAVAASFCKTYRCKTFASASYLHLFLRHLRIVGLMEQYQNVATNGIANFQSQRFLKARIAVPLDENNFENLMTPLMDILNNNIAGILGSLRNSRDLLLPKLVTGEIKV